MPVLDRDIDSYNRLINYAIRQAGQNVMHGSMSEFLFGEFSRRDVLDLKYQIRLAGFRVFYGRHTPERPQCFSMLMRAPVLYPATCQFAVKNTIDLGHRMFRIFLKK